VQRNGTILIQNGLLILACFDKSGEVCHGTPPPFRGPSILGLVCFQSPLTTTNHSPNIHAISKNTPKVPVIKKRLWYMIHTETRYSCMHASTTTAIITITIIIIIYLSIHHPSHSPLASPNNASRQHSVKTPNRTAQPGNKTKANDYFYFILSQTEAPPQGVLSRAPILLIHFAIPRHDPLRPPS